MAVRPITDDEVAAYDERGWAYLPGLISFELVERMRAAAEAELAASSGVDHGALVEKSFMVHRGDVREGGPSAEAALSPVMGRNMGRLIGVPRVRLETDTLITKAPLGQGRQRDTIWHQDFPGHTFDRSGFATLWVALSDLKAEAGTMRFVEGSQRLGVLGNVFVGADGMDLFAHYPKLGALPLSPPLDMKAGDATVHHSLIVHGAPPNRSDGHRIGRAFIFFDADTLYRGGDYTLFGEVNLELNQPFDHPAFPLVPVA